MPLTVVHRQTLPARRPLDGFTSPRLGVVERDGSVRPGGRTTREEAWISEKAETRPTKQAAGKKPATVTDIASHRPGEAALSGRQAPRPGTDEGVRRRTQRLMLSAAVTPPAVWLAHAVLHLLGMI